MMIRTAYSRLRFLILVSGVVGFTGWLRRFPAGRWYADRRDSFHGLERARSASSSWMARHTTWKSRSETTADIGSAHVRRAGFPRLRKSVMPLHAGNTARRCSERE